MNIRLSIWQVLFNGNKPVFIHHFALSVRECRNQQRLPDESITRLFSWPFELFNLLIDTIIRTFKPCSLFYI